MSVVCLSVISMKALTAQQQVLCQSTEELTRCSQIEEIRFCSLKHHLCFHGTGQRGGKGAGITLRPVTAYIRHESVNCKEARSQLAELLGVVSVGNKTGPS